MLQRPWWKACPSAAWVERGTAGDDDAAKKEGSKSVWALDRRVDPLLGRTLPYWPEASGAGGPQTCNNSPALLAEHHRVNGAAVRTRFPPEPNGYLHLGHAKSMNMNFSLAFERLAAAGAPPKRRETVFRYDDTNPEAETKEFIDSLAKDVAWMGWAPVKTTHTSDYFGVFYELALELIKGGKAYVCHQKPAEIEACRSVAKARAALRALEASGEKPPPQVVEEARVCEPTAHESPFRDRGVDENLKLFERMRTGVCPEGECTLRLKMDATAANFNMFDQVAYRIKHCAHPHAGDKWCIYPTYDYTHCIVDALEHVDYSICTLEFETRRESYYWVLDALDLYRPKVFEMSRLNVSHVVLSKRKLTKLVDNGHVVGWDDPRMPTISGLRRRGYSAAAVNAFCRDVGVTRNENFIEYARLQHFARADLEERAPRRMAVRDPLPVTLTGDASHFKGYDAPNHPTDASFGTRSLTLTHNVFIERDDFREADDKDFYGLAPLKWVRLRWCACVRCVSVDKKDGKVVGITCEVGDPGSDPKGKLHWVSDADSTPCELRDYGHLFRVGKVEDDWESQINPESLVARKTALVDASVGSRPDDFAPVQFERLGFYCCDPDSKDGALVFNLTVSLKTGDVAKKVAGVSRKAEQEAQAAKKEALKKIPPEELFKTAEAKRLYSAWDGDGVPTLDSKGEPLSKSLIKKCKKDQAKQKKLYEAGKK
mmetsp:Transcript_36528/g.111982  ORF Transcript_36528/g.111982 Transcript_36528/m.111982 type:complete len:713 (+) Transcript_36528:238-2376(+)